MSIRHAMAKWLERNGPRRGYTRRMLGLRDAVDANKDEVLRNTIRHLLDEQQRQLDEWAAEQEDGWHQLRAEVNKLKGGIRHED